MSDLVDVYTSEYARHFPSGGDEADHANAVRAGLEAVTAVQAARLAQEGEFDKWTRLAHVDRRNGTAEAADAIVRFLLAGV